MAQATLFDPTTGKRVAVESGSQQAQQLFGKGYQLETNITNSPNTAGATNVHSFGGNQQGAYITPTPTPTPSPTPTSGGTTLPTASDNAGANLPTPTADATKTIQNFNYQLTPDEIAAQNARNEWLKINAPGSEPDKNAIYSGKLTEFQSQIDAINQLYADQLNKALAAQKLTNEKRLGSNRALQARSGMLGSDFGGAQTDTINQASDAEAQALTEQINNRKAEAVAAIMGQVRQSADAEYQAKVDARRKGADALVAYYDSVPERQASAVSNVVAALIAQGVDPSNMSPEQLNKIASDLQVNPDTIRAQYKTTKDEQDAAAAKAKKEGMQNVVTVSPGSSVYDPNTGKIVATSPEKSNDLEVAKFIFQNVSQFDQLDPKAQQSTADALGISVDALRKMGASARNQLAQEAANDRQAKDAFTQSLDMAKLALSAPRGTTVVVGGNQVQGLKVPAARGAKGSTSSDKAFWAAIDKGISQLNSGSSWGDVWNRVAQQFPEIDPNVIDRGLGLDKREKGYYQNLVGSKSQSQAAGNAAGKGNSAISDLVNKSLANHQ